MKRCPDCNTTVLREKRDTYTHLYCSSPLCDWFQDIDPDGSPHEHRKVSSKHWMAVRDRVNAR